MEEKPIYKSKKHVAYAFTALLLLLAVILKAPETVVEHLAMGLGYSLPVLIGGQAWIDARRAAAPVKSEQ